MSAASAVTRILGSRPISAAARRVERRLRVLAYHGVPDAAAFRAHVEHLGSHYRVVSLSDVLDAVRGRRSLPASAVWITFDDGEPSTVLTGLPILRDAGMQATMYVVPSVLGTSEPLWWEVVRAAVADGLAEPNVERQLKVVPDADRRTAVDRLRGALAARTWRQLTDAELSSWVDAGNSIGSHTWDHPMLDRCSDDEQVRQVVAADDALASWFDGTRTFAYPNGTWAPSAERALSRLGYDLAVVCDHRLSGLRAPLRVSRLRVDADAPIERFRAIVSGAHTAGFGLLGAVRRGHSG